MAKMDERSRAQFAGRRKQAGEALLSALVVAAAAAAPGVWTGLAASRLLLRALRPLLQHCIAERLSVAQHKGSHAVAVSSRSVLHQLR